MEKRHFSFCVTFLSIDFCFNLSTSLPPFQPGTFPYKEDIMSTNNMCLVFAVLIFIGCILSFKVSPQSLCITADSPNLPCFSLFGALVIESPASICMMFKTVQLHRKGKCQTHRYRLHKFTERLFPLELPFYRYCHVIKAIKSQMVHISCSMNHMACIMNPPV